MSGLYVVTDALATPAATMVSQVAAALRGGARIVQYRDKGCGYERRRAEATALVAVCRCHGALFLVNDEVALASAVGASGVHLGKDDRLPREARAILGPDAVIGVSCYDSLAHAEAAAAEGASYVAFGRFFPSRTKPTAVPASVELLQRARERLNLPIAAIGGITAENASTLIAAGADMLAVVHGVFGQPDCAAAARRIAALF